MTGQLVYLAAQEHALDLECLAVKDARARRAARPRSRWIIGTWLLAFRAPI
jgi:hypothetical protein